MPEFSMWDRFAADPRLASNAALRATDSDRNLAAAALSDAYADGRLDREEYDQRVTEVSAAKTYGELLGPLEDLAPGSSAVSVSGSAAAPVAGAGAQAIAEEKYEQVRSRAVASFAGVSLICWTIWFAILITESTWIFPWPAIVSAALLAKVIHVVVTKRTMIARRREAIEQDQAAQIRHRPD